MLLLVAMKELTLRRSGLAAPNEYLYIIDYEEEKEDWLGRNLQFSQVWMKWKTNLSVGPDMYLINIVCGQRMVCIVWVTY